MKIKDVAMPKTTPADAVYTEALNHALKSIYKVYGSDLSAFFQDVKDEPLAHGKYKNSIEVHSAIIQTQAQKAVKAKSTR
jgi:hypothetical protein